MKFPHKHRILMNFLSNVLREEGGFEYKKAIVDCILCLVKKIPDATEAGLTHLSEFIEDGEFTYLSSQVLHLLGELGPSTADPGKYIRYIYNRVILENATIRASAVCALASFGSCSVALRARVSILLQRCLYDNDDEVRDRAAFFLSALRKSSSETDSHRNDDASTYLLAPLELSLQKYLQETVDSAFDVGAVSQLENDNASHPDMHATSVDRTLPNTSSSSECDLRESENVIMSRPEFMSYGPIFKARAFLYPFRTQIKTPTTEILCIFCWYLQTCHAVELTEAETEYKVRSNARTKMCLDVFIADFVESYQVTCTKHIFKEHVVFHFKCSNTIEDQILENVSVVMEIIEGTEAFAEVLTVPLGTMPLGQFGSTFVSYERAQVWISFLRTRPQDVNLFCNAGTLSSC